MILTCSCLIIHRYLVTMRNPSKYGTILYGCYCGTYEDLLLEVKDFNDINLF